MSSYPEFSVPHQNYKFHSITQSYNPKVADQPRPRQPNENPKDYMLSTYTSIELVFEINAATAIYRLDPFVKYVCAWRTEVAPEEQVAIQARTQWRHPNLISFLFIDNQKGLRIFYEYLALDVKQLILRRATTKSYVPEPELYKFLQGLSSACSFLEKKGIHHGALHLESVYFDEEYLLYRIQDVSPFRVKAPNLFKNPYPAPELQQNVSANKYKVDVFSLGIVILSMMLLKDCGNLFVQGVLDQQQLLSCFEEASKIYSSRLMQIVEKMVELNASLRVDWSALSQLVDEPQQQPPKVIRQASSQRLRPSVKDDPNETKQIENRRNTETRVQSTQGSSSKPRGPKIDQKLLQLTNKIQETLAKSQNTQLRS